MISSLQSRFPGRAKNLSLILSFSLLIALPMAMPASYTTEFRIYESDPLLIGDNQLIYWHGVAGFPSILNMKQDSLLIEGWKLDTPDHVLEWNGETVFNFTLISEGLDGLSGKFYLTGRIEADWDIVGILEGEWLDRQSHGEPAVFDFMIQNPENHPFEFDFQPSSPWDFLQIDLSTGGKPVVGPWHAPPGDSTTLSLSVTPAEEAPPGIHPFHLTVLGQLDAPVIDSSSHISLVSSEISLNLHLVDDDGKVSAPTLMIMYPVRTVEVGDVVEFEATLLNELDVSTEFEISVSLPEGLAESSSITVGGQQTSLIVLGSGESTNIKLTLDTSTGIQSGNYQIPLTVTFDGGQVSGSFDLEVTSEIPTYQTEIQISTTDLVFEAGEEIMYTFEISNTGKLQDTYLLALDAPQDWEGSFSLPEGQARNILLDPGQEQELTLTITPPTGFTGQVNMVIRAQSSESGSTEAPIQLEVLQPEAPTLSTFSLEKHAGPGDMVDFGLLLFNPGPGTMEFDVEMELPMDFPGHFTLTINGGEGSSFFLESGQTATITVAIQVDGDAGPQIHAFSLNVDYSSDWLGEGVVRQDLTLRVTDVDEDVLLTSSYPALRVEAGQTVGFETVLANMLLTESTFQVTYDIPDGLGDPVITINGKQTDVVMLDPGASATINIQIETLPEAEPGSYEFEISVSWASGKTTLPLDLVITGDDAIYDMDIDVEIPHLIVPAGQQACFTFVLTNEGKLEDDFSLDVDLPDGWESSFQIGGSEGLVVKLSPGEQKDISICVMPPSYESGIHTLKLMVESVSGQTGVQTDLVLDVEHREPPEASSLYPDKIVETGDSVQYRVDLINPSNQPIEFWLDLESDPELPGTYEITVDGQQATHFIVEGGATSVISINIDTFTNATMGTYNLNLVATYSYEGEEPGQNVSLPLVMILEETIPEYSLEAELNYPSQTIIAGNIAQFTLTLSNEGKLEDTYTLRTNVSASWTSGFIIADRVVKTIQIEAGETATPKLELTSPLTEIGEVTVEGQAESLATGEVETFLMYLTLESSPDISILVGNLLLESNAGEETSVEIDVLNPGNTPITNVQLQIDAPEEWGMEYSPMQITEIPPGGQETITMTLTIPSTTPRGDYLVPVMAISDQMDTEEINLRVSVERGGATGYFSLIIIVIVFGGLIFFFRRFGRR